MRTSEFILTIAGTDYIGGLMIAQNRYVTRIIVYPHTNSLYKNKKILTYLQTVFHTGELKMFQMNN